MVIMQLKVKIKLKGKFFLPKINLLKWMKEMVSIDLIEFHLEEES